MTKDEFAAAPPDTFFVFTAHLLKNAFDQKSPHDQSATFVLAAKEWAGAQGRNVRDGIIAVSPSAEPAKSGRGAATFIATKASAQSLLDAFSGAVSHLSFAAYAPPPVQAQPERAPGIRKNHL